MRTGMRFMDKLWRIRTAAEPEGCAELASMVLRLLVPQGWRHGGLIQCQAGAAARWRWPLALQHRGPGAVQHTLLAAKVAA